MSSKRKDKNRKNKIENLSKTITPTGGPSINESQQTTEFINKSESTYQPIPKLKETIKIWKEDSLSDRYMVIITFVIGVCTIFTVWYGYRQISVYTNAVTIENKAYIVIGDTRISNVEMGKVPKVQWQITNAGKTPAYHVRNRFRYKLGTNIYEQDSIAVVNIPFKDDGAVLGGGLSVWQHAEYPHSLDAQEFDDIKNGRRTLFLLIDISYVDYFDNIRYSQIGTEYVFGDNNMSLSNGFSGAN